MPKDGNTVMNNFALQKASYWKMGTQYFSTLFNALKFWMFGARTPSTSTRSCVNGAHVAACGGMVCLALCSVLTQSQGPAPPWSFGDSPLTRAGLKHVAKVFELSWNYLCQLGQWPPVHSCLTPILTGPQARGYLRGKVASCLSVIGIFLFVACGML